MPESNRNKIAIRLVGLQRLIEGCTYLPNIPWLARCLQVDERTILHDLDALEEAGWFVPPKRTKETT